MARTRTSDPVRAPALRYAATSKQRHAKPTVYAGLARPGCGHPLPARAAGIIVALLIGACAAPQASAAPGGRSQVAAPGAPCAECQVLSALPGQIAPLPAPLQGTRVLVRPETRTGPDAVAAALAAIREKGGRGGVHLTAVDSTVAGTSFAGAELILLEAPAGEPDGVAFDLKRALAAARGANAAARLAIAADRATLDALAARGIEAYVDVLVPPVAPIQRPEELLSGAGDTGLRVWTLPPDPGPANAIASAAAALQSWLPAGLASVPDRALTCGGDRRLPTFLNPQTLDLVAVSRDCPAGAVVASDLRGAAVERLDVGASAAFRVRAGAPEGFATGVDVAAARTLTVEEIVARHQAAAARQAASITTEIAEGSMTLTFEAPGFVAPVTVTSRTTIFSGEGGTDLRQRDITVNGVRFAAGGGVPRLPIIEPERAAAPPLAITLSDVYRYRLDGRDTIDGRQVFVVAFSPRDRRAPLYRGRAWIDAGTFGMMRVSAAQTGLTGPITASEQTDRFTIDAEGRWLLARSDVHQTYEGASVRTPIHRRLVIDRHEINPPDFAARRAEAHASADVMLRDTPEGYRYLTKQAAGNGQREAGSRQSETVERVVAGRAARIRTFAFGVIVDPNISVPLPFAGLSYVDFDLFGTGTQFNGFFGGSFGQLAFSVPSIAGTRWQLAGRAFGIASSYNDRAFEQGREQYTLGIRQRPARAAVWLLRPLSPRASLRIEYGWDYTAFGAADTTAPGFLVPRNQNAHGLRGGLDLQRGGWQGSVWGSYTRRIGWRRWGMPGLETTATAYRPAHADFQRYGASVLRSQALSPRLTVRIEGAVMGGADLDRFSRYAFGSFDNRLHGYPSALIRYDRGGVVRTAAAWTALRGLRVDAFADAAAVHDPGFGPGLRQYTGFGAALEAPAPFGTLVSVEWGYGLQGIDANGRRGTQVVRISGYKVF
jgi:hypothetical protein